jgi:uncharacterized protein YjiS (DUF1127 family)
MAFVNIPLTSRFNLSERVASALRILKESADRAATFRRTMRELNALSERELADLGMHRSMVTRIAHEAAYGK